MAQGKNKTIYTFSSIGIMFSYRDDGFLLCALLPTSERNYSIICLIMIED